MSPFDTSKNISRIRTFKEDVEHSRSKNTKPETSIQLPRSEKITQEERPIVSSLSSLNESIQTQIKPKVSQGVTAKQRKITENYLVLTDEIEQIARPRKESILTDDNTYTAGGGIIIRDTKRKRFRLIPAMISAVVSWFSGIKTEYDNALHPVHTVTRAETRAEVIQKAASQSERAPKEDLKEVVEHLKNIERTPITSTLTFKEKSEVPKPTWASASGSPDRIPEIPVSTAEEQITQPIATPILREEIKEPVPVAYKRDEPEEIVPAITIKEQEPVVTEETQYEVPIALETPEVQIVETAVAETPRRTDISPKRYAPARSKEYVPFPIATFMIVIIGASLLGIGASYYWFASKDVPETKAIVYKVPALITASSQVLFELPQDRLNMLIEVLSRVQKSSSVTQVYPTVQDENGNVKPASVEDIMQKLELHAPGSFTRSIKEITFGSTADAQPFIIMKATSFDVAFAGMLEWEQTQSADLFPLFGQPVVETFDSTARTDTQVRSAFFKDTIASNKNVRLLVDETGKDRIIYTFTDQNTILITTTREALDALLPLVK